jgi:hypothetical protein
MPVNPVTYTDFKNSVVFTVIKYVVGIDNDLKHRKSKENNYAAKKTPFTTSAAQVHPCF